METRPIPKTGERLPVVGLGTWQSFDVGEDAVSRAPLMDVTERFFERGGRVIDSSPMYGRSESVTGDLVANLALNGHTHPKPFLATKVWARGSERGKSEMERSMRRMRAGTIDLMQIHNLLDYKTHLPILREWKEQGRIRYIGITHYAHSAFDEMERLLRTEALDFVQLPYSLLDRAAERRLLPLAQDTGTAVLVMRPFDEGALFRRVRGKSLPDWSAEFACTSWSSFFLKFILSHPAVTCPIPATSSPEHVAENLEAGTKDLPDEATRQKMIAVVS
jgi:aryl-alcohol dehydrogenase-like predicted oxidoreductase